MSKKTLSNQPDPSRSDNRAAKRSQFTQASQPSKKKGAPVWLIALPIFLLAVIGAVVIGGQQQGGASSASQATTASADGLGYVGGINSQAPNKRYPQITADAEGNFHFPVSGFADGKARFFTTNLPDGKTINFFILKSSDGIIRAAIDACDVCYSARKGYHQEGDVMVCNNCGQRFPSAKINEVKGGCNPAPLTRTIQGDSVVIKLSDLEKENRAENGQPLF